MQFKSKDMDSEDDERLAYNNENKNRPKDSDYE
jgi:hypothetical protein